MAKRIDLDPGVTVPVSDPGPEHEEEKEQCIC